MQGKVIPHHGEAIVLRTWPFHEADLLVSLFTREQGKVKGVARHAMRSRRRFGGALEPATHVRAHYTERPRQELVRLDSFEILWSPLSAPIDYLRTAALQLVAEVLEEAMPEGAPEDNVFRLALTVLQSMQESSPQPRCPGSGPSDPGSQRHKPGCPTSPLHGDVGLRNAKSTPPQPTPQKPAPQKPAPPPPNIWLPITYFALWMNRLMGWMPELGHCAACGLDLRTPETKSVYWSPTADGVTCRDDRRPGSRALAATSVLESHRIARTPLAELATEPWPRERSADLRAFALGVLERHLERRLRSATALT